MEKYLHLLSQGDKIGLTLIRLSIAIVFMWIGLLKFVPYEADSITPFVANSPVMSFFYEHPEEYKRHCCKVSDEAAFCLIQRPYISKTLLTRRISPRGSP